MVLPEGTDVAKTYLLFSVKDQSPVLGEGLLLGEALLPLADIVKEDGDVSLRVSHINCNLILIGNPITVSDSATFMRMEK